MYEKKYPSITVIADIAKPVNAVFRYIVPVDLAHIFRGTGNLPAIIKTSNEKVWYTPGLFRIITFADGNTACETLKTVDEPSSFSYEIVNFTSGLKRLVSKIEGSWKFTKMDASNTHIEWTYTFVPLSDELTETINTTIIPGVNVSLSGALQVLKEDLESGNYTSIN